MRGRGFILVVLLAAAAVGPAFTDAATDPSAVHAEVLDHLLEMAGRYQQEGALHQSMALYFSLLEKHPNAPQAALARDRLLRLADEFAAQGLRRHAAEILERLM